ncbi:MAG: DNA gyrase inhibitor YacG [Gammaproteobacteria bacterium]|nr:DNA gyrase inhibitor YacG [Gammaproteobacteria bacterium]
MCPTCKRHFTWISDSPWRPFCSERCRIIDLGEWLDEGYRFRGPSNNTDSTPWSDGE